MRKSLIHSGAKLWFDVEKKYKTITQGCRKRVPRLWFDVEKKYKTISFALKVWRLELWFDVEKKYKTNW